MKKEMNDKELEELRHINRMEEIKFELECKTKIENLRFDHELQLQRIKSAEIQKSLLRKERYHRWN